jgi:sulfate adenylyltransferase subunit 1 (EFTu-like GTPase family)
MNNNFEMSIAALFHFKDGNNVFVGSIKEGTTLKNGEKVKIVVDGKETETIEINTMFVTPPPPNNQKSLSTYNEISLTKELVKKYDCRLIGIEID